MSARSHQVKVSVTLAVNMALLSSKVERHRDIVGTASDTVHYESKMMSSNPYGMDLAKRSLDEKNRPTAGETRGRCHLNISFV